MEQTRYARAYRSAVQNQAALSVENFLDSQTHLRRMNCCLAKLGSSVICLNWALDKAEM